MDLTQLQSQLSMKFTILAIYFALCAMKGQQYDQHHQFSPKLKLMKHKSTRILYNIIRPLLQKKNTARYSKKKNMPSYHSISISTNIHPTECENYMTGSDRHAMIKFGRCLKVVVNCI